MRHFIAAVLMMTICAGAADAATKRSFSGDSGGVNITMFSGVKTMKKSDWEPIQDHQETAIRFDVKYPNWPVSLALDLYTSTAEDLTFMNGTLTDVEGSTDELRVGIRSYTGSVVRMFWGIGLANISYDYEQTDWATSVKESDETGWGEAWWAEVGIDASLKPLTIGLLLGYSSGEGELENGDKIELGGTHLGMTFGLSF